MITILAYDTSFAAAYNLRKAFSLWEETRLITMLPHERWPEDTDILLTQDNAREYRRLIEKSRFTMFADASGIWAGMLEQIGPVDWKRWAKRQKWVAFFGDTPYFYDAATYNKLMEEIGCKTLFILPDLMHLAPAGAIPLHHPVPRYEPVAKAGKLTIMHSPGTNKKRRKKGSDRIERVIERLRRDGHSFDYETLMGLSNAECVARKATAHIFIDQLPAPGLPAGLGRSGEEGLSLGCVVLTSIYTNKNVEGFFELPPVTPVYDEDDLYLALKGIITHYTKEALAEHMALSRVWAEKYLHFEGWLDYVGRGITRQR